MSHSFSFRVLPALLATSLVSCSLDLSVPETPKRGGLTGRLDTQGRVTVQGHEVQLVADDNTQSTQRTDAQGNFTFGDLAPGSYFLEVKVPGFAPYVRPSIRVLGGQQYDVGVLAPTWLQNSPQAATVLGKVVVEGGSGDTNGAQVEFVLEGVNQTVALAAVTSSGLFVQRVPPGTYTLRASHPLFVTQVSMGVVVGEAENKDMSMQPMVLALNPATLTGKLLKEVDGQAAVAASGALVTFEGTGVTTTTDTTGQFQLAGLPAGTSAVRFSFAGFHDAVLSRPVRLEPGATTTVPDVTLQLDRGDLVGEVRTSDGQPVTDATVSIPGTTYATQVVADPTDASRGNFSLRGLPTGAYSVRAAKARYIAAVSPNTTVVANTATPLPATLTLALQQGDFDIDDGDATNVAGYARTTSVTLKLNFANAATFRASEDPSFATSSFVPYTGGDQPFTLSNTQGTHVVYAQFEDAASNRSATFSSTVVLDSVAPVSPAILINGGVGFTNQPNPLALTLTASDVPAPGIDTVSGLGAVRVTETAPVGGQLSSTARVYFRDLAFVPSSLSDGSKTVYAQFVDNAGNRSAVVSATVVVDTLPPNMPSLSIAQGSLASAPGYTNSALVQLTLSAAAEPNGGFVSVRLANSSTALARATYTPLAQDVAWFLDPSTQGTKTVSAEFRDAAGNTASVLTASTIYDTVAPSPVTLAVVGGLTTTNDAGVPLSVSAVDTNGLSATTGLTLSEDLSFQGAVLGPAAMPGSGLVTFSLPPGDGVRRIYARFRDIAGNDATASVTVTLDTVAPTGSIEAFGVLADGTASTSRTSSTGITVNITATGATGYLLGNDSLSTCPTAAASYTAVPVVTTGLAATLTSTPGTRLVKLCLRDAAGNLAGPFTDSLVLDSAVPTGCTLALSGTLADGLTAAPSGQTARSQVTATVASCSSDVAEYVIAGGTVACSPTMVANWVPFSGPSTAQAFLLTGGEGTNTVSGCYRDASRNVASLSAATISLDTTPPSALGITLNGGAAFLGQAQLVSGQPTVTIAGSAVGATQWAFAESNPTTYASYTGASSTLTLGGAGLRTVYARFRDDLGNLSSVVSATITVDTTAPSTAGAAFRIDTPDGGAYVSSNSVTLLMTPPSDATQQQVVERSASGACAAGDYASAVTTPVATSAVFLLSSSPGAKRVCIRWFDAASNPSASLVDTKTLDTAAPSQPFILASDRVFNPNTTGEASGSWISIVNTVDPQHFDWQVLGGQANQWTSTPAAAPSGSTPGCTTGLCLRALLSTSASAEAGTQNTIRLREVDAAGNASAEASIVLTTDIVPPRPVSLSSFWVDNRSTSAVVRWQPRDGGSPDTVGHYVYYSAAPGYPGDGGTAPPLDYIGTNASEGPSPILVGNTNSATLSSLANGGLTYVTVRPVDRAGNLGASAQSTPEVVLQPNEVSPTHIGTLSLGITLGPGLDAGVLTGSPYATSVEVIGDTAYVYGGWWTGYSTITPVALGGIVSPSQGGIVGPGTLPTVLTTVYSADGQSFAGRPGAMVAEPPYLFTAAGNFFRVWTIARSTVPELVTSIDLSAYLTGPLHLNALDVRGTMAFAVGFNGNEVLFHLDVGQLYDNDSSTNSIVVRSAVTATNFGVPQGIMWTRNRLFFGNEAGVTSIWDLTNAQDASNASVMSYSNVTSWPTNSRITAGIGWSMNRWRGLFSGNIGILSEPTSLRVLNAAQSWTPSSPYFVDVSRTPLVARGQYQVAADQYFVSESSYSGLQTASLFDMNAPVDTGAARPVGGTVAMRGIGLYGNYAIQTSEAVVPTTMRLYEVAAPRALRRKMAMGYPAGRPTVMPGFIVGGTGLVVDMLSGGSRLATPVPSEGCVMDGVVFDDTLISSRFTYSAGTYYGDFRIMSLDSFMSRTPSGTVTSNSTSVWTSTSNTRYTGMERFGNYLIVTSTRGATPGSGPSTLWVEVYRANGLRSRATNAARSFSTLPVASGGDKVAEYQYDTVNNPFYNSSTTGMSVRIRMNGRYAVISNRTVWDTSSPGAYLLDLGPLLDDNASTTMNSTHVLARIGKRTTETFAFIPTDGVLKNGFLYFSGNSDIGQGLFIYNAGDAFDGNAGTTLDGDDRVAFEPQAGANSIDVAGAYAVVTGSTAAATVSSYDISVPANPKLLSEMAYTGQILPGSCYTDLGTTTVILGGRVYVGSHERLDIVDLE